MTVKRFGGLEGAGSPGRSPSADKPQATVEPQPPGRSEAAREEGPAATAGWAARGPRPRVAAVGFKEAVKIDVQHDGWFLGAAGVLFEPGTPLSMVPPVLPNNGKPVTSTVVLINGIMTAEALHAEDMQALANTGSAVVGIRNANEGLEADLAQCIKDKADVGRNPTVDTTVTVLMDALEHDRRIHLIGHSQGALIVSRALTDVKNRLLLERGLTPEQATTLLERVTVETFGGAARRYVDSPAYTHYINQEDHVPEATGLGASWLAEPGAGAIVKTFREKNEATRLPPLSDGLENYFARFVDRTVHGPQDVYFKHRGEP